MKKLYEQEYECCGCEACCNACPVSAIEMKENKTGELFPEVDLNKCIQCGKCLKVCPLKNDNLGMKSLSAYAAISKNQDLYKNATSGGIFAVIAMYIIGQGGMVVGSCLEYDNEISVKHKCINSVIQISDLQGSKYVQSRIGNVFSKIKDALKQNNIVLFSGTPCQVAGLKAYLGREYPNLYTMDIVCHGVPSMKFLRDHISYLEHKNKYTIKKIEFRKKGATHSGVDLRISYEKNGKMNYTDVWPLFDSYYQLFLDGHTYRESCYSCKYANDMRQGDLTICDFWGATEELSSTEMQQKKIVPENGLSGVLVNTDKGMMLFKAIESQITGCVVEPQQIIKWNAQLKRPSVKKDLWYEARDLYSSNQDVFEKWYKKRYGFQILKFKLKLFLLTGVPQDVRSRLKKFLKGN